MLEAVIKPKWPEDFKRIIAITYRFSAGWRKVHNPETGHDVADDLTTTEFAIAMLAARGWTNQEIAEHLHISVNTVKKPYPRGNAEAGCGESEGFEKVHVAIGDARGKGPWAFPVLFPCFKLPSAPQLLESLPIPQRGPLPKFLCFYGAMA